MPPIPLDQISFEFFARYVLTGFIIFVIRNAYAVGERPKIGEIALDVALFSLINQLVWQLSTWFGGLALGAALKVSTTPDAVLGLVPGDRFAFFCEVVGLPILLGVALGQALRADWARSVLRRLAMPAVDPLPRAYDHVFSQRGTGYVIVTYKDKTQVYGWYGAESRAGRDPNRSELYLERVYVPHADGPWTEMQPPRAILLNLAEVRSIEFIE